jgi:type IV pilus assembly protein PilC
MSINISTYKTQEREVPKRKSSDSTLLKLEFNKGFSDKNRVEFYKEFATLLKSSVDFRQALAILKNQQKKKTHQELIGQITTSVIRGKSLHEALQESGKFTAYEYFSVKIGEETRKLGEVFSSLSQYFERKVKMKRQVISVMTYPAFVLVLTFGVLYFMLKFVVPMLN